MRKERKMNTFLTLLGPIVKVWLKMMCRRRLPQTSGMLRLNGLNDTVDILRDHWGIPHIYAQSIHDLVFAQGYVHAQDRLWQMEFQRRVSSGRLAEIFGKDVLEVDRWMRVIGLRRAAVNDVHTIAREILLEQEAYAEGVNAFIKTGRLPVECALLRHTPERWTPCDTISWNKLMSWSLSTNWESELIRKRVFEALGKINGEELEPGYNDACPVILSPGEHAARDANNPLNKNDDARRFIGPSAKDGIGSNCWVISGSRTASGKPILANDMHLMLGLPSIWYENHLICGSFEVAGITAPGVPMIITGHNTKVAWGFTAGLADVQDLYEERLMPVKRGEVQYEYRGKWLPAEVVREKIMIRGGKHVFEDVVITRHGPVINKLASQVSGKNPYALRWSAYDTDTTPKAMYGLIRAKNCTDAHEALRYWVTPNLNVVYADTEGNIAYTCAGALPVRESGQGKVPVPGWSGEYEWHGSIPFEKLPHLQNPPEGFIVTANNKITQEGTHSSILQEHCTGDRALRITELIKARSSIDVPYTKKMQYDLCSPTARTVTRHLHSLETDEPELAPLLSRMKKWDGTLYASSTEAAVYEVFMRHLITALVPNELDELVQYYMGKGVNPHLSQFSMFGWHSWEWLIKVLRDDTSECWRQGRENTKDETMLSALRSAVAWMKDTFGPSSLEECTWGRIHTLTFSHPFSRIRALARFFNRGPYPLGGDGTTVWSGFSNMHDLDSATVVGPPYRFIADLSHLEDSKGQLVPGQSGNPASDHYDDQIDGWFSGEYHPLTVPSGKLRDEKTTRLQLIPDHSFPSK
jgi:penicillin amidase